MKSLLRVARVLAVSPLLFLACCKGKSDQAADEKRDGPAEAASSPEGVPKHLALVVGVAKYKSREITPLNGCAQDVADIRETLVTMGFEPENIKSLLDDQATHAGIVDAFRTHLIERAGPETTVVFYFSGHGSQMPTRDPGEADGKCETICPHDTRVGDVYDISDKEIAALLDQLTRKTSKVTLIFDSCHSATVTKDRAVAKRERVSRHVTADTRPTPSLREAPQGKIKNVFPGQPGVEPAQGLGYTALFGCRANQSSYETQFGEGWRGAFTYSLCRQLREKWQSVTLREMLEQSRSDVATWIGDQQPTAMGNLDATIFGDQVIDQDPYFLIKTVGGANLVMAAGSSLGVTEGSVFKIYPPDTRSFDGQEQARAIVKKVSPFEAQLAIDGPAVAIATRSRAVEHIHSFGADTFPVSIQLADPAIRKSAEEALKECPGLVSTPDAKDANLMLVPGADGGVDLVDATAAILFESVPKEEATKEELIKIIRRWSKWLANVNLINPRVKFDGEIHVKLSKPREGGRKGIGGLPLPEHTYVAGDALDLEVKNLSGRKLYFAVLDFSSDGSISMIYPEGHMAEEIQPGGRWHTAKPLDLWLPEGRDRVRDILKVVFTKEPVSYEDLVTDRNGTPRNFGYRFEWAAAQRVFDVVKPE